MRITYNNGSGAIETVYTYEEWLRKYKHRKTKRRIRQKTEHLYYIKQRLTGVIMIFIGIITSFILDRDATFSLVALPLGIFLMVTKEKVVEL